MYDHFTWDSVTLLLLSELWDIVTPLLHICTYNVTISGEYPAFTNISPVRRPIA